MKEKIKMEELYYEVLLAKKGDIIANEKIINRYKKYNGRKL